MAGGYALHFPVCLFVERFDAPFIDEHLQRLQGTFDGAYAACGRGCGIQHGPQCRLAERDECPVDSPSRHWEGSKGRNCYRIARLRDLERNFSECHDGVDVTQVRVAFLMPSQDIHDGGTKFGTLLGRRDSEHLSHRGPESDRVGTPQSLSDGELRGFLGGGGVLLENARAEGRSEEQG